MSYQNELLRIGRIIEARIKSRKDAIAKISKDTKISKRIVYNIIQGKENYTVKNLIVLSSYLSLSLSFKRRAKTEEKVTK